MLTAADVTRGASFYKNVFGLKPGYESPEWTELMQNGTTVALHGGADTTERDTGLGFYVEDIEAARAADAAADGEANKPTPSPPAQGFTHMTGTETKGHPLSVSPPTSH